MTATYSIVPNDDLIFVQGSTFLRSYTVYDEDGNRVDLSGASARGEFRVDYRSEGVLADQQVVITDPLNGELDTEVDAIVTSTVEAPRFKGDIEVEWPDGTVMRVVNQDLSNDFEVTR